MTTEYIICKFFININEDDFFEQLIQKYQQKDKNLLLQYFNNKNELYNINYKIIHITDDYYLYIINNELFIKAIKEIEKNNKKLYNDFIFVKIKNEIIPYIKFNSDLITSIYNDNKIKLYFDISKYKLLYDDDYLNEFLIYIEIDIIKYNKDLIEQNLNKDEILKKYINSQNEIIEFEYL